MRKILLVAVVFGSISEIPAHASVLAADSFVCSGASQVGLGSGVGFTGNWIADPAESIIFTTAPSSLIGPIGLVASGGSMSYDGAPLQSGGSLSSHYGARIYRALDLSATGLAASLGLLENHTTFFGNQQLGLGLPGTSVWLGFLLNGGTAGNGIGAVQNLAQVHLYDGLNLNMLSADDNNKDGEVMAIGRGNLNVNWNYERTCAHSPCGGISSSQGYVSAVQMDSATHWAVLRFDFISSAITTITFWLDPTPGQTAPTASSALTLTWNGSSGKSANVPALHFNWIEFGGQTKRFALDELRVSDSFSDLSFGSAGGSCNDNLFLDGFE
jgi:hypothetical protein